MNSVVILALRALLILIGVGIVFAQVRIIPIIGAGLVGDAEMPELAIPYSVAGILLAACIEVVLIATWMLLSIVKANAIFTARASLWVDVILSAGIISTVIAAILGAHVALVVEPPLDAPGVTVVAGAGVTCWAAFVLLMLVMRGLLRNATSLRTELAEVV